MTRHNIQLRTSALDHEKDKPIERAFGGLFVPDEFLDSLADVYNGFVFWSMLTSLGLCVWYFPLWHMGISGYEVIIMATVSPVLLVVPPLRSLIVRNLRTVHLLSLSGVLAYLIADPLHRLFAVGAGVSLSCLAWSASWWAVRGHSVGLEARTVAWTIGLIMSSVSKFGLYTNNPIWPVMHADNGGWNKTGLLLAVIAILRATRQRPPRDADIIMTPGKDKRGSGVLAAFGLAGVLFGMHSLLSDSSTMILWVWEGFPVRGPIASPHGAWTLFAMTVGVCIGIYRQDLVKTWTFYGIAAVGAAMLTTFSHWWGFYGGLLVATYLMAAAPAFIAAAAKQSPALTFGLGFLLYNILALAHVWVVAYAFVPGGPLMREHTDWVMTATLLCMGAGVFNVQQTPSASLAKSKKKPQQAGKVATRQRSYYMYILLGLQLLSVSIAYLRFPTYDYTPYHPDQKLITAGIWTVHFSIDNDLWSSHTRMRDLIKDMELDVVGLLETDLQRIIMGNRDTAQFLAEDLGMYVDQGPGPNKHTWGAVLLSKFPIVNSTHHLLPSPVGELAPAIHATLDCYGELVDVFVFHSGQEEDPEDRRLQSLYLADLMKASPRPSILLSYLVTKPKEGNYNTYVGEQSGMRDIDPSDWDRWCEYILYKGIRRSGYARVSRSTITDTELQVGKFVVGTPEGGDEILGESDVEEGLRFPAKMKGEGLRGHAYHVFEEPRYYH